MRKNNENKFDYFASYMSEKKESIRYSILNYIHQVKRNLELGEEFFFF